MNSLEKDYLSIVIQQFKNFKTRAEEALQQLSDEDIHWKPNVESNNIAIIIQHISGNMNSRWTNFLTTDGEKDYRERDMEFIDRGETRTNLMRYWEDGWNLLFDTLENLEAKQLHQTVTLRQQPISVLQAIQTEIAHISYHLGQILFIGKQIKEKDWTILSIPKNGSKEYNLIHSSKK
ncbi:hypothetical protein B4U37_16690 [Sutcliffiella horikoshii]|uniref:DUF1572 domain-containing protein n=1 Tax=Sutcliffiella horikoshii TaxID=79883 RepID=A0ABN4ZNM1_9BACI|nr:DUF1572 family protein [Sutcliffiella horikoshii]ART77591.1 hypothetical protein B4U37_16690 [Sutcliffiella horikoshii]